MIITKHGVMRFKQRQKIKNSGEMKRKVTCAVKRGKLLEHASSSSDTKCYLFDGYYYIVAGRNNRLVTVFRAHKPKLKSKKLMLDDIKIKEFNNELRYSLASTY